MEFPLTLVELSLLGVGWVGEALRTLPLFCCPLFKGKCLLGERCQAFINQKQCPHKLEKTKSHML